MNQWHTLSVDDAVKSLHVDPNNGLSDTDANDRLRKHGPNELEDRGIKSLWLILWEQLTAVMVIILIVAALVSLFLGEINDAIAIIVIVVLNAILGLRQEYRAEKAMAALKKLAVPQVRVRRNGAVTNIGARDIVPGDIVLLEAGSQVPADCRVLESANLRVDEASLTGESVPVEKTDETLSQADLPLADRRNLVYMGTNVTYGRGSCLVIETGMRTELGKIAEMIQSVDRSSTPLQVRLDSLGKSLAIIAFLLVLLIFGLGLWREGFSHLRQLFLVAVSMAVAAVPEGLPAVVTIALALGAQRMLSRHALIRKLLAVEALGSVTAICTDKTGTLTENRMSLLTIFVDGNHFQKNDFSESTVRAQIMLTLAGGTLCNDSEMRPSAPKQAPEIIGDPTEAALTLAAAECGLLRAELEIPLPRVNEAPFDSTRKRMTTLHRLADPSVLQKIGVNPTGTVEYIGFTKGSVDGLLEVCDFALHQGHAVKLTEAIRRSYHDASDSLAEKGMRVLGVAFRTYDLMPEVIEPSDIEHSLTFIGISALIDPPRAEAKDAVALCISAGIRPIMITGDHPLTARHIAAELGIASADARVVTGAELETMNPQDLAEAMREVSVFARIDPESKLDLVKALQAQGHIVAMTGDGVNDAPALKKANIGISMGIAGTDVAKEASDIILLDDNFATIVAAVAEGRTIYDNIRKFIKYLMTTNSGELWVMITAPLLGMPLPLLPLQILWMNLVTDGLPALALGVEPPERGVMRRKPTKPGESIFAHGLGAHIIWVGMLMGLISLGTGWWYWRIEPATGDAATRWQTMTFTVLTLSQMANVMAVRSGTESLFTVGPWSNLPLLLAVIATTALQFALIYIPFLQIFFKTAPLTASDMLIALALSSVVFWIIEIEKAIIRISRKKTLVTDDVAS